MLNYILSLFISVNSAPPSTYNNVQQVMARIQQANPVTTQIIDVGISESGHRIQALKIGSGRTSSLVMGTIHGNEYGSTAVALAAAESFAQNPLKNQTVYVIPVMNAVGYDARSRQERSAKGSIDLNRDFPGPCRSGNALRSRTSQILANFIDSHNITHSAALHTFAPAVLYPWGFSTRDLETEYDDVFIKLSRDATVESGYRYGNSNALLYAADGTFEDYAFLKSGVWSLLFELGRSHYPSVTEIEQMISTNVPGIRRFFENAPRERAANFQFTGVCDRSVPQRHEVTE